MRFILLFLAIFVCSGAHAQEIVENNLTIYSSIAPGSVNPSMYRPSPGSNADGWYYQNIPGYAVVRSVRNMHLRDKTNEVRASDVAALIDPTTVTFKSLSDPSGTSVAEQNYHFDLVSLQALAERYVDKIVSFEKRKSENKDPEIMTGKLLSVQGRQLVIQLGDGSVVNTDAASAIFPKLPGELYTRPTLIWEVATGLHGQTHKVETSYETGGMTWWADYNATYSDGKDANNGFLDLSAWVTIVNKSGASYPDSGLKLVAGDVQKVASSGSGGFAEGAMDVQMMTAPKRKGFEEKSFFEYHMYALGRKTSLPDNSTKQIELFPQVAKIPVEKLMVYDGSRGAYYYGGINMDKGYGGQGNKKIDVYLKFKNSEKNNMGMPLPKGRVRVNKVDDDGSMEFIGEDAIDHTPRDEEILLKLGEAFDVVGERVQKDFQVDNNRRWMKETVEVSLRNHKKEDVRVMVSENLYRGANWKITTTTDKFNKKDSNTAEFSVAVPKSGEKVVRYTVEYTW